MQAASPVRELPSHAIVKFRWKFIIVPVWLLGIAAVLTAAFYAFLPDPVAYRFMEVHADKWVSRGAMAAWLIAPHLVFCLISYGMVRIILLSAKYWDDESDLISRVLPLLGNMTGIAQAILVFAAIQVFVYNTSGTLLAPFWIPAVLIMVLGGLVLVVSFFRVFGDPRRRPSPPREKFNEDSFFS